MGGALPLSPVGPGGLACGKAWPGQVIGEGQTGEWGKGLDSQFPEVSTAAEEEEST